MGALRRAKKGEGAMFNGTHTAVLHARSTSP